MAGLQTEFDFELPKGFIDTTGTLHRKGKMRLATAMDEIIPLRDPRVRNNQAYLSIILLSKVVTRLGTLETSDINTGVMERLFSADLAYLQALYNRINSPTYDGKTCPTCNRPYYEDEGESSEEVGREAVVGG
ncbi:phage tail assembly protein [Candidatus Chlorohelix allophototropha]|uniref:Phage tail assembly protein n=1 Tax=Candidatus Chlorohelix allophototropha TaxID=3003348 RepID=A0ABY9B2S4_9CHLR|nr:phage tail assembly protein [Chloroflexota bacterium L227-S17]